MNSLFFASCLTLVVFGAGALRMQDTKSERFAYPKSKDADGGMARWMATMTPGPAHARLKELLGSYDTTQRIWMGGPGTKPMEIVGTCEIGWFAEGKWIEARYAGTGFDGKPMKGLWLLGYDNFKERYLLNNIDSVQTSMNTAFGLFEQTGDHLIMWGTIDEPMTPEQDKQVKYVFRNYGQDKSVFEIHDMMIGEGDTKVVEVEYRRRK